jgi:hypothetical protein
MKPWKLRPRRGGRGVVDGGGRFRRPRPVPLISSLASHRVQFTPEAFPPLPVGSSFSDVIISNLPVKALLPGRRKRPYR